MAELRKVISELQACIDDSVAAVVPTDTVIDAIALLEAIELCDDCISREAVRGMKPKDDSPDVYKIGYLDALLQVVNLPGVMPKVQAARVISREYFVDNPIAGEDGLVPVYIESRSGKCEWLCMNDEGYDVATEGGSYRVWDGKPTDEQRKETPWK